jgi:hypothetical protein
LLTRFSRRWDGGTHGHRKLTRAEGWTCSWVRELISVLVVIRRDVHRGRNVSLLGRTARRQSRPAAALRHNCNAWRSSLAASFSIPHARRKRLAPQTVNQPVRRANLQRPEDPIVQREPAHHAQLCRPTHRWKRSRLTAAAAPCAPGRCPRARGEPTTCLRCRFGSHIAQTSCRTLPSNGGCVRVG